MAITFPAIIGKSESNLQVQGSSLNMSGNPFILEQVAPPVHPDPYWANVVTILHFDGTNELSATSSVDSGPYTFTLYETGSTLLTGSAKFGTACMKPVSGAYVIDGSNKDAFYVSASTDFTLEFWFNGQMPVNTANNGMFKTRVGASDIGWGLRGYRTSDNHSFLYCTYGTGSSSAFAIYNGKDTGIWDGVWHHLAIVRYGTSANNVTIYLDGKYDNTYNGRASWNGDFNVSTPLILGTTYDGAEYADSLINIDEVRWTNGVARYTSNNFTPPTAAFDDINS